MVKDYCIHLYQNFGGREITFPEMCVCCGNFENSSFFRISDEQTHLGGTYTANYKFDGKIPCCTHCKSHINIVENSLLPYIGLFLFTILSIGALFVINEHGFSDSGSKIALIFLWLMIMFLALVELGTNWAKIVFFLGLAFFYSIILISLGGLGVNFLILGLIIPIAVIANYFLGRNMLEKKAKSLMKPDCITPGKPFLYKLGNPTTFYFKNFKFASSFAEINHSEIEK